MGTIDSKSPEQREFLKDTLIERIRQLRRYRFTIREIAERIGWPKGKSRTLLRQIAGPMPKAAAGEAALDHSDPRRHVGSLYGGRW